MGKKKKKVMGGQGGTGSEDGVDDDAVESLREALGGRLNAKVIAQEIRAAQGDTDRCGSSALLISCTVYYFRYTKNSCLGGL